MKKLSALIICVLVMIACRNQPYITPTPMSSITPQVILPSGNSTRILTVEGRERSYILHIPPKYDLNELVPIVLIFHGGAGNAENAIKMTDFSDLADTVGFFAVYPNGSGKLNDKLLTWNSGNCCAYAQENNINDVAFVRAILDDLRNIASIDNKRVYATGMSNGGMMSYRLACELSEQIAAIGPVSGTQNLAMCEPEQSVAVIHFHGTDDNHLPYDGGVGSDSLIRVNYTSVHNSIQFWVTYNQCSPTPATVSFGEIAHTVYDSCVDGTAVELYTILGGEHAWPGGQLERKDGDVPTQTISATQIIWNFFAAHPKP